MPDDKLPYLAGYRHCVYGPEYLLAVLLTLEGRKAQVCIDFSIVCLGCHLSMSTKCAYKRLSTPQILTFPADLLA